MNKWKKILATCLTAGMILGTMPTSAWAAAAKVIVEPTYVYGQVYNFDANNTAQVQDAEWKSMTVTASDAGLAASPAAKGLSSYYDEATGKFGYKDANEKVVISAVYDEAVTGRSENPSKPLVVEKGGKYGAINWSGKTVVPFQYDGMYPCYGADGYYEVCVGESWGVVDAAGKVVVPTVYSYIQDNDKLADGTLVFWVSQGENDVVVSAVTGQPLFTMPAEYYSKGYFNGTNLVPVGEAATSKCGYMDYTGNLAVPAIFDEAMNFCGSLTYVGVRGDDSTVNYAVMNNQGVLITEYVYENVYNVSGGDGLIAVQDTTNKWGYMDATGTMVVPCQYDSAGDFSGGIAMVSLDDESNYATHYGLIDTTGGIVLPVQYSNIGASYDDYDGVSDYVWISQRIGYDDYYGLAKIDRTAASAPAPVVTPSAPTATPTSYPVILNGEPVAFDVYALKDENGNDTNYFKLRDIAFKLNGTSAQFNVGWEDGATLITTATAYEANGSEMSAPFTGPQTVSGVKTTTLVNGTEAALDYIVLQDASGNGYTYYKLRDLGEACGFTVDYDAAAGAIVIGTN